MLVPKKIGKKKITFYVFIIIAMLAGAAFFVVKNYTLTSARSLLVFDPIEEFRVSGDVVGEKAKNIEKAEFLKTDEQTMDLKLFDEGKFNNLKENIISVKDFVVGKDNLFKP